MISVRVCCLSPVCCDSEVSADVAVICRLALLSDRAENTMLHRDGRKAESTLSSDVEGAETQTQRQRHTQKQMIFICFLVLNLYGHVHTAAKLSP